MSVSILLFLSTPRSWNHEYGSVIWKISAVGNDPVLIKIKNFNQTASTDLLSYLVLETSFYTQQQFKALRSLKAYNQMVTGFI